MKYVPCTYLVNINIKDVLLCIKDTTLPHIFNSSLFKKNKTTQFLIFSHMRNLTTSMLMFCVMVGRGSNSKMQAAFPPFLVAKGVSWTPAQSVVRSSAKFGCYQFPQLLMRSSQLKACTWTDSKWTPTHSWNQMRVLSFSLCPSLSSIYAASWPAARPACPIFPSAGATPVLHGAEAFLLLEHACGDASAPAWPRLRPIRAEPALCLPGSPTYLHPDLESHSGTDWPCAKRTSFITWRAATCQ